MTDDDKTMIFIRDTLLMALGALSVSQQDTLVGNVTERIKVAISKIDAAKPR